jgi:fumarate hydratase subunit beta
MTDIIEIFTPLTDDVIKTLKAGQMVHITGDLYTARDLAHIRLMELLDNNKPMPFDFKGNIVFYAGPSPTPEGMVSGSIGPTTAGRMDLYAPVLIGHGLKAMLGKGLRSSATKQAIKEHCGIYFAGTGGIAALMSKCVKSVDLVAFEDLGTEAIRKLRVEKLPAIVAIDCEGNDIYQR